MIRFRWKTVQYEKGMAYIKYIDCSHRLRIHIDVQLGVGAYDFIVLRATSYPRAFLASTSVRISIQVCYGKQAFAVLSATRPKT